LHVLSLIGFNQTILRPLNALVMYALGVIEMPIGMNYTAVCDKCLNTYNFIALSWGQAVKLVKEQGWERISEKLDLKKGESPNPHYYCPCCSDNRNKLFPKPKPKKSKND